MYVIACVVGVFRQSASAKRATKAEKQIKPIERMKILQGRVAPPYGDASLGVYPTSNFFFIFLYCLC